RPDADRRRRFPVFSAVGPTLLLADAVRVGHRLARSFLDEGAVALAPEHEGLALVGVADARARRGLLQGASRTVALGEDDMPAGQRHAVGRGAAGAGEV